MGTANMKSDLKLVVAALLVSTLAACSSSEKSSEKEEGSGGSDTISVDAPAHSSASHSKTDSGEPAAPPAKAPSPQQSANALNDAHKKGDDELLQRVASGLLAQNPNDAKALHSLGLVNYRRGRYLAAMYYFNNALKHNPNMSDCYTNMGLTQLALDERRDAIRSFKKAMELNANDGAAAANLGSIYASEGDYVKAQMVLDRAIKAGVKDSRIYNNYGIALTATGKYEDAKEIYKEAIKLDRNNRDALFNFAILQVDHLNDWNGGLDTLNQLRFLGLADGMRDRINALENKAKSGSNK